MRNLIGLIIVLFGLSLAAPQLGAAAATAPATPSVPAASAGPVVNVHSLANVSGDTITLGDVCDIKGAGKNLAAKLEAVELGRAPLSGVTRTLTTGDISLKLRQAGIDPKTVSFAGSDSVTVSQDGSDYSSSSSSSQLAAGELPAAGQQPGQSSASPSKPAVRQVVVHCGDTVTATYVDGPVTVTVAATALSDGCAGDTIQVRTSFSDHYLRATIVDPQNVLIKE